MSDAQRIANAIATYRLPLTNEAALQDAVARVLDSLGVDFKREKRLSDKDRVDFFTYDGLAIELKIDGGSNDVLRQLMRYADHGSVHALMLITTRSKHRNLPDRILGKPLTVYQVIAL